MKYTKLLYFNVLYRTFHKKIIQENIVYEMVHDVSMIYMMDMSTNPSLGELSEAGVALTSRRVEVQSLCFCWYLLDCWKCCFLNYLPLNKTKHCSPYARYSSALMNICTMNVHVNPWLWVSAYFAFFSLYLFLHNKHWWWILQFTCYVNWLNVLKRAVGNK